MTPSRTNVGKRRMQPRVLLSILAASILPAQASTPQFTPAEQEWIKHHPVVYYAGAPNISPLEDVVAGRYVGLIPAYLEKVSQRTGIRFQLIPSTTWEESQQAFLSGKADLFPNASPMTVSKQVNEQLLYTQAYFASPLIFVTRGDAEATFGRESLEGKRVAIRGGKDVQKILTDLRPGVIPVEVTSPEQSLRLVLRGDADASVGTEATLQPLLRRKYGNSLGVASMLDLPPYRAQMGVRATEPILHAIVNKALNSITAHESDEIYENYLTQADYGSPTVWSIYHYRRLEVTVATLGMLLLAFFAWRARVERRRALRSERAKTRFLATMSHEIRTPINAMLGSIEMLGRTPLDPRQKAFSDSAAVAAEALVDLLDNVLDLSKLDAGKLTLERLPTDLGELMGNAVSLARPRAEEKGLTINLGIEHVDDALVLLDPTRMRQVLNNLLGNAVKFTRRGCINVDALIARESDADNQGTLHVRITDTGVGIPLEQQARLFDAYSQADGSTTREFGGTGLGLTICRELIEMMGGKIVLDSIPGTGTTIALTVPVGLVSPSVHSIASAAAADIAVPGDEGAPARIGGRVLVVEDHPGNRALIREQLLELGVRPTLVETGAAAVQAVAHDTFDLVLMDCHMPGMDGYEATRRIRAQPRSGPHLPIVAISASTGAEHLAECLDSGMDGVLRKPLRLEELRSTLELWPVNLDGEGAVKTIMNADPAGINHVALLREDLRGLQRAVRVSDLALARHHAHRLAGAALMLSLGEVATLAQQIEATVIRGNMPGPGDIPALAKAIDLVAIDRPDPG